MVLVAGLIGFSLAALVRHVQLRNLIIVALLCKGTLQLEMLFN